jgi:3-phosphoshikimate 1-carboxyvinyltransferase
MYDISFLDLPPLRAAGGCIRLPGSKSISNRVLLLAGLSEGCTEVHDLLDSDDTRVMLDALRTLGCTLEHRDTGVWAITGIGGMPAVREASLFLGNAGTAMRPLAAALAVLAALHGGRYAVSGVPRMHERPIGDLVDALRQLGCRIDELGVPGFPPLRLCGSGVDGMAPGRLDTVREIRVRGDVSSQFLTALLLALPLASTERAIHIAVDGELISKPYVEITLNLLARFGIAVQRQGFARFTIPQGSRYRSPGRIHVEADASSASYFIALGALAGLDAPVRIEGVGLDSIQGDIRFIEAARAMGAVVEGGPAHLEVRRGAWPLRALTMDCNHIPDAAMTLAVMALYADGTSRLTNIGSWRVKETDRIAAMASELRKLGAVVDEGAGLDRRDGRPRAGRHRLHSTPTTITASRCACRWPRSTRPACAVRILDPRCVAKTFPDYFEALFFVARGRCRGHPRHRDRRPDRLRQGHAGGARGAALGWHQLDSGLLYRATALAAQRRAWRPTTSPQWRAWLPAAAALRRRARCCSTARTSPQICAWKHVGAMASRISAPRPCAARCNALQLSFRRLPGLVADGRDMGTVIFPGAPLKVFLTASAADPRRTPV